MIGYSLKHCRGKFQVKHHTTEEDLIVQLNTTIFVIVQSCWVVTLHCKYYNKDDNDVSVSIVKYHLLPAVFVFTKCIKKLCTTNGFHPVKNRSLLNSAKLNLQLSWTTSNYLLITKRTVKTLIILRTHPTYHLFTSSPPYFQVPIYLSSL